MRHLQASGLPWTLDYVARPIDASSDAGGDFSKVYDDEAGPSAALISAMSVEHPMHQVDQPHPVEIFELADEDPEFPSTPPEAEGLHEGAAERVELAAWLLMHADGDDRAFDRAFTKSERAEIIGEIRELRTHIRTLTELNLEQREALEHSLEKLQSGSERMGRKDWFTFALGVGTTLVITEIIPPLVLLPLAVHAIHALGHLLVLDA